MSGKYQSQKESGSPGDPRTNKAHLIVRLKFRARAVMPERNKTKLIQQPNKYIGQNRCWDLNTKNILGILKQKFIKGPIHILKKLAVGRKRKFYSGE